MSASNIPRLVQPIKLSGYAKEYGDSVIWVWFNLPYAARKDLGNSLNTFINFSDKLSNGDIAESEAIDNWHEKWIVWFTDIWSQHPDIETHWTVEEFLELERRDPNLTIWIMKQTVNIISNHLFDDHPGFLLN